ncbi:LysR family transcriptional regulator [Escherichia coli]|uniref:LysR family transcriptional regulator n=1 Tax=Escherichia coli TaxID=562 RepID=A0A2X1KJG5_ECOLX|nr:LysR family transcriptional regulator [Escherichia coli]
MNGRSGFLQDVGQMMDELSDVRQVPQGMLRIISSFGFGRQVVAPALSALAKAYPQLELRFDVEDRLVDLVNEGVDLDIRIGDDIAPNLIARKLGDQLPYSLRVAGIYCATWRAETFNRSFCIAVPGH